MQRVNVGKFLAANMFVWGKSSHLRKKFSSSKTNIFRNNYPLHRLCSGLYWSNGSSSSLGYLRMYYLSNLPPLDRSMVHLTRAHYAIHHIGNCKCRYADHCKSHQLQNRVPSPETSWWTCTMERDFNILGMPYTNQFRPRLLYSWGTT
jgi:hypothetical protein